MVFTGCMRSGTKSLATMLGLDFEEHFTPGTKATDFGIALHDEVSWMAMPFHKQIRTVIHLVREPIAVINSLLGIKFFAFKGQHVSNHDQYLNFAERHLPGLRKAREINQIYAAMYYYVYWNKPLMAYPRIRIEDIANAPHLNQRKRATLDWSDLPGCELLTELEEMRDEFGYS